MVIGNGLLAKAFKKYEDNEQVLIFASGVSNSKENNPDSFKREIDLMKSMDRDKTIVYFSTCSVYDFQVQNTEYVKHKYLMETIASSYFRKSIIFRLPTVVGKTDNNNTFFNFFKKQIESNIPLRLTEGTTRYLIDIDDLSNILPHIIDRHIEEDKSCKMNIAFDNKLEVVDLVNMMMEILNKRVPVSFDSGGFSYEIKNSDFKEHLQSINYLEPENYTYKLLKKYLI